MQIFFPIITHVIVNLLVWSRHLDVITDLCFQLKKKKKKEIKVSLMKLISQTEKLVTNWCQINVIHLSFLIWSNLQSYTHFNLNFSHSSLNRMTGREFFTRFPALYPFLLSQLQEAAASVNRWEFPNKRPPITSQDPAMCVRFASDVVKELNDPSVR